MTQQTPGRGGHGTQFMSRWSLILALIGASVACDGAEGEGERASRASGKRGAWDEGLRREVLRMHEQDQEVRQALIELLRAGVPVDTIAIQRLAATQDSVDRANTTRLEGIVRANGWPSIERAGSEVASAAFTIVQHATHDLAFQKEYLAFLEEEYRMGRVPGEPVALLTDRTRQAEGKPQLYGTQISIRDGKLEVDPIEDEENVDRRRRALGLPPLAEYIEEVKATYGISDPDADRP